MSQETMSPRYVIQSSSSGLFLTASLRWVRLFRDATLFPSFRAAIDAAVEESGDPHEMQIVLEVFD